MAIALPTKIILRIHRYFSILEIGSIECCSLLINRRWRRRNIILWFWWGRMNHVLAPFLEIDVLTNLCLVDVNVWRVTGIKSLHAVILVRDFLLNYWWWLMLLEGLQLWVSNILSDFLSGIFFFNFVYLVFFLDNAWLLPLKLADRRRRKLVFFIAFIIMRYARSLALFRDSLHFDI